MEKLLFTGGTGFLGRNIKPELSKKYEVTTIGPTVKDDLKVDIAASCVLAKSTFSLPCRYDIVLHAAGKAHVYPKTEEEKRSFYDINYHGTVNLCRALENTPPHSLVFISTIAVYGSIPGCNDTENSRTLIGDSPYADSKIKAELFLSSWCAEHGVILTILRPSLIAGNGAPGNLGAMVNGIKTGRYLSINHGVAKKSIVMAEDIANLVMLAADKGGVFNVCDNYNPSFGELEKVVAAQLGKRPPISIPYWLAKCIAIAGDVLGDWFPINSSRLRKIVTDDIFSSEKAQRELGWKPLSVLENYRI